MKLQVTVSPGSRLAGRAAEQLALTSPNTVSSTELMVTVSTNEVFSTTMVKVTLSPVSGTLVGLAVLVVTIEDGTSL